MAASIQAAQAVADIRAGMAVAEDPEFDSLMRAGERGARGGSSEGEGFSGEDGGEDGQNGGGQQGQQPRQAAPAIPPADPDVDPLTDLRGPSAYAPAPPLPVGFAEFPVAPRGGRSRATRRSLGGTGMTITAVQQPGILRAEPGAPSATARKDWQTGNDWQSGPRVQAGIDFTGLLGRTPAVASHPDPMERFADAGRRKREALDLLFERFEGMQPKARDGVARTTDAGMNISVATTLPRLHPEAYSRN